MFIQPSNFKFGIQQYGFHAAALGLLSAILYAIRQTNALFPQLIKEIKIMSTSTVSLDQAVTDLVTTVSATISEQATVVTSIQTLVAELANAPADSDVSQQVANIEAQVALLAQSNATLQAAVNAVPSQTTPPVTGQ